MELHHQALPAAEQGKTAVLLLAKSAFAAAPHREMRRIADLVAHRPGVARALHCFCEQGTPSLRDALLQVRDGPFRAIVIVPLVLPMEPGFHNWLMRTLARWQGEHAGPWPPIHVARDLARSHYLEPLLADLLEDAATCRPVASSGREGADASLVPPQKRRVLVCQGRACNAAGADVIWGHLRNRQQERKLRVTGDGTMTARTTCLGPCSLAPVLQVFPEGTYYGGVTEAAVDRIVDEHLLGGAIVDDFAYAPTGRKQRLRTTPTASPTQPKQQENQHET